MSQQSVDEYENSSGSSTLTEGTKVFRGRTSKSSDLARRYSNPHLSRLRSQHPLPGWMYTASMPDLSQTKNSEEFAVNLLIKAFSYGGCLNYPMFGDINSQYPSYMLSRWRTSSNPDEEPLEGGISVEKYFEPELFHLEAASRGEQLDNPLPFMNEMEEEGDAEVEEYVDIKTLIEEFSRVPDPDSGDEWRSEEEDDARENVLSTLTHPEEEEPQRAKPEQSAMRMTSNEIEETYFSSPRVRSTTQRAPLRTQY